jgi:hypothetical protein
MRGRHRRAALRTGARAGAEVVAAAGAEADAGAAAFAAPAPEDHRPPAQRRHEQRPKRDDGITPRGSRGVPQAALPKRIQLLAKLRDPAPVGDTGPVPRHRAMPARGWRSESLLKTDPRYRGISPLHPNGAVPDLATKGRPSSRCGYKRHARPDDVAGCDDRRYSGRQHHAGGPDEGREVN